MERLNKIRKWFSLRFGREPEEDKGYFEEWLRRFRKGEAFLLMDSYSLKVWYALD